MIKYADFGTVSHGTMRNEDLLATFADELEKHDKRNADAFTEANATGNQIAAWNTTLHEHAKLIAEARDIDADSEDASEIVQELFEALNEYAPPYAYFGSTEGDGSDYGFWVSQDSIDEFDGLRVDDLSAIPADYSGEAMVINDHGNVSLYNVANGETTEIWAVV